MEKVSLFRNLIVLFWAVSGVQQDFSFFVAESRCLSFIAQ